MKTINGKVRTVRALKEHASVPKTLCEQGPDVSKSHRRVTFGVLINEFDGDLT